MSQTIETRSTPIEFIPVDQVGTSRKISVDIDALEADLREHVRGEVRFDGGTRGMYAHDGGNYRMTPLGVVLPLDADDAAATIAACHRHGAPIHGRGGGTAIPGQTVNHGVVIDFSKYMHSVLELDTEKKLARVQPGTVLDTLRDAAKPAKLTFGPDPATHSRCTLGGMIGNNSCGIHSQMAGRTADNIASLEIALYDGTRMTVGPTSDDELDRIIREGGRKGEIYGRLRSLRDRYADEIRKRYPKIPRRISGYNLDELLPEKGFNVARALVGSEGTCVTVLEATTNLVYNPPVRSLLVLGYKDIFEAGEHVVDVIPYKPVGLEGMDDSFIQDMVLKGLHDPGIALMPEGKGWLLCEFGGESKEGSDAPARKLMDELKGKPDAPAMKLFDDPEMEKHLWHLREEGLGATADVPGKPENHEGWEDAAVPPEKLGPYLKDFKKLMDRYAYEGSLYGHFGQGCVHTRLTFDLLTKSGIEKYRHFVQEAADLVVSYGGSLSGEHGDGQMRGELLPRMFGKDLMEAFREFKTIWDPDWKMNPGKIIAPFGLGEYLYEGADYNPPHLDTHFHFVDDKHSFARAANRCVGAGVCRRHHHGVMCPSYQVTLEEKHSTRGRARMLFEMVRGEVVTDGWKSEEVKSALDLCLSCKGCKGDCPVQVDMATYKAEFLSHYYEGRARPRHAYAFGLIMYWAQLAAKMPGVVNLLTRLPVLSGVAKKMTGMAPERTIPAFAPMTFREWFEQRARPESADGETGRPEVILWADTFNNHFHPAAAVAAVEVLETAGFKVTVPDQHLCCGRPLYDYGFLDLARRFLNTILEQMRPYLINDIPVVVLEPSCAAVFKDEMPNLLPDNEDARRLSDLVFMLSDFLEKKAPDFQYPRLERKALMHGHCHHKSLLGMKPELSVFQKMGLKVDQPDPGCCGMAGAFGFEEGDHYDVAVKVGNLGLVPAVKDAPDDTLIIADGFSCREQIQQSTDRKALHLSQVMLMALQQGPAGTRGDYPENDYFTLDSAGIRRVSERSARVTAPGSLSANSDGNGEHAAGGGAMRTAAIAGAGVAVVGALLIGARVYLGATHSNGQRPNGSAPPPAPQPDSPPAERPAGAEGNGHSWPGPEGAGE